MEGAMAEARVEAEMTAAVMVLVKEEATSHLRGGTRARKGGSRAHTRCVWARELQRCTRMEAHKQ